jgi:hypothetical protein
MKWTLSANNFGLDLDTSLDATGDSTTNAAVRTAAAADEFSSAGAFFIEQEGEEELNASAKTASRFDREWRAIG